ncbi:Conidiation protein 6-domain-containing protein [Schizophyllum commune]
MVGGVNCEDPENPGRVAAGLKASIHNPNVSDEAKQSAIERLHDMGADVDDAPIQHAADRNTRSKGVDIVDDMLQDADDEEEELQHSSGRRATGGASRKTASGKNEDNVIRGYKATLHNPRIGDEAKERAQEYLEEHDAA